MKEQELLKKGLDIIEKMFNHFTKSDLEIAKEILEYKEEVNTHLGSKKPIQAQHEEKIPDIVLNTTEGKSDDVTAKTKVKNDVVKDIPKKTVVETFPWETKEEL